MGIFKGPNPNRLEKYHQRRRWARRLSWVLYGLVFTGLLAGVAAAGYIYYHFLSDLPDFTSIKEFRPSVVTTIYARDGRPIGEFYSERRIEVPYSRLPRHLILAFVAAEDARFFEHPGVDVTGIVRAFFRNLEAGEVVQGGSTITQQVVKRILLTSEKSFARKIREAVLAYRIDNYLTKEEILNLYLNHIFLGHGAYGVEAAAQEYFSKHVEDLSLAESAILAGIPKAPSRYDPVSEPPAVQGAPDLRPQAHGGCGVHQQGRRGRGRSRQPIKLKPFRPDWIKECGYFNEHVRTLLENRFGKESVYNLGLQGLHHRGRGAAQGRPEGHQGGDQRPHPAQRLPGPPAAPEGQGADRLSRPAEQVLPQVSPPRGSVGDRGGDPVRQAPPGGEPPPGGTCRASCRSRPRESAGPPVWRRPCGPGTWCRSA